MALFKNIYRVESAGLDEWVNSNNAAYFVTICARGMQSYFGKIVKGKTELSGTGKIVEEEWMRTGDVRDNVVPDEYVIMPNQIHGILMITSDKENTAESILQNVIKSFKSACSARILKQNNKDFGWQPGYHEHIIRSEKELLNIRQRITNNPENMTDKFTEKF